MNVQQTAGILREALLKRYDSRELPAVLSQADEWSRTQPLSGLRILDATPLYFNTVSKYMALISGGAELTVSYGGCNPFDPGMPDYLKEHGIRAVSCDSAELKNETFDLILDCSAMHKDIRSRLGYVELTRSGVLEYEKHDLRVFMADSGRVKQIETCLGTGESCLRALKSLGLGDTVSGSRIVIFGYGKVGSGIAMYLTEAGAKISAVDPIVHSGAKHFAEEILVPADPRVRQRIKEAAYIICVTGREDTVQDFTNDILNSKARLINMGVLDEFGPEIPTDRVLNQKQPLNFLLNEPTLLRYIDPTMALHNAGGLYLLQHPEQTGKIIPPAELETSILDHVFKADLISEELRRSKI